MKGVVVMIFGIWPGIFGFGSWFVSILELSNENDPKDTDVNLPFFLWWHVLS